MTEKAVVVTIKPEDMHCSNCFYGHQIVAGMGGGNIEDDGTKTSWVLLRRIPVGQTRNCFGLVEKVLSQLDFIKLNHFIYPNEDDTCINPKKFMAK